MKSKNPNSKKPELKLVKVGPIGKPKKLPPKQKKSPPPVKPTSKY